RSGLSRRLRASLEVVDRGAVVTRVSDLGVPLADEVQKGFGAHLPVALGPVGAQGPNSYASVGWGHFLPVSALVDSAHRVKDRTRACLAEQHRIDQLGAEEPS